MSFYQFKTNINCNNCLNTVTPFLNKDKNIAHWEVDLTDADRTLTVEAEAPSNEVIETIKLAGFKAELI